MNWLLDSLNGIVLPALEMNIPGKVDSEPVMGSPQYSSL